MRERLSAPGTTVVYRCRHNPDIAVGTQLCLWTFLRMQACILRHLHAQA